MPRHATPRHATPRHAMPCHCRSGGTATNCLQPGAFWGLASWLATPLHRARPCQVHARALASAQ
eukprot:1340310-Lingulodinium_polyedra.AAC.1